MTTNAAAEAQKDLQQLQQILARLQSKVPEFGPNWVAINIGPECESIRALCRRVSELIGTGDAGSWRVGTGGSTGTGGPGGYR